MIKKTEYQTISCSLEKSMIENIDKIAKDFSMTRIGVIRLLLTESIKSYYNFNKKGGD